MITSNQMGVLGFLLAIMIGAFLLPAVHKLKGREEWYEEGWQDCLGTYKNFGMSADDEIVLRHLKSALRAYVDLKGYRRKGDVKLMSKIENFDDLKDITWQICEREKKGKKKCSK